MGEWLLTSNWLLIGSREEIRPAVGTSHGRATLGPSVAVALLVSRHASCVFVCTGVWCRWDTNDEGTPDPAQLLDREAGASKSTSVPPSDVLVSSPWWLQVTRLEVAGSSSGRGRRALAFQSCPSSVPLTLFIGRQFHCPHLSLRNSCLSEWRTGKPWFWGWHLSVDCNVWFLFRQHLELHRAFVWVHVPAWDQTPQGGSLWLFIQMEQGSPRGDVPSVCATASSQESWFSSTGPVFGPHVICPLMDF